MEFRLGNGDGQQHEHDGHGKAVAVGIEQFFHLREDFAHHRAQHQRKRDFQRGIDQHGDEINRAAAQRARHAEGHREHHQTHRVVQRDDGQQDVGQLALRLILAHDHQRRGRRRGGGNRAQRDGGGNGQLVAQNEVQPDQRRVHKQRGHQTLHDTNDRSLLSRLLQRGKAELVSDGEGDEAQRHVGHQIQSLDGLQRVEAHRQVQPAEGVGADQHARDQIGGHVRQTQLLHDAGHHQTRQHGKSNGQKQIHTSLLLSSQNTLASYQKQC